ncbi:MAG: UDP-N-acetylmuramate--L-alanine ligase [Phycisphaerales bacterium]|nr:MAG: UDP-N-acetylmuramate--L-alanine ligase [Phycisphaerales bacterium]
MVDSDPRGGRTASAKSTPRYETIDVARRPNLAGKRFHFIGAGGVGMSGLAQLLVRNKGIVTGSDLAASSVTANLCRIGADIRIGHCKDNLDANTDAVVFSAAIKEDNPELVLARERGCKVYKYAQMLGMLCDRYEGVAISGTHGKSTTTGWLSFLLRQAGIDASFVVGADVPQLGGSSGVGDSNCFIVEACEYDRSFLNLRPRIACVLNIEPDHLDYYRDEEDIINAFGEFALGIKPGGVLIANGQDANVAEAIRGVRLDNDSERDWYDRVSSKDIRCETFGLDADCDFHAENMMQDAGLHTFDVYYRDTLLGATRMSLAGRHNVMNALAVTAMAINVGVPAEQTMRLLPSFTGVDRRLMLKQQLGEITVLDDYAHHPTEIKATLDAIRQRYQPRRIWCIFQPHQYSRTRFLLDDFAESFKLADVTIVPDIYFVRDSEAAKKEVNSRVLVERLRENGAQAVFIADFGAICDYLIHNVAAGDLVVTMGAGDVWKVADGYIQRLRGDS